MKQLLPLTLLIMFVLFGVMWVISAGQSLESGVDVSGTQYETATDDVTHTAQTTISLISMVASIVGVALFVGAIGFLRRAI